ncbi:ABC transporter substrate-binding protein [Leucobacter sp. UCMA 4100]|uniref:ABC transporter substrate-binding protein n=1 Tax=Leucobacter sp. UCMA 4100 TaxID=2810534 RepID=UPI0022EA88D9|nr:ABC transporter substrate-binding protein [Leucobacter sp. UCMA 4100]MDA3146713.1 ABC transporter substrate-binding protein [Leucobacter sp. UCMA 4100]
MFERSSRKARSWLSIVGAAAAVALAVTGCGSTGGNGAQSPKTDQGDNELFQLLPEEVQKSGVLIIGTDPGYPPCDFVDNSTGDIAGYNHDILKVMEPHLGVEIRQEALQFDGLIPGVQSGRFQGAMECISDNEERRKVVTFVDNAYGANGLMVMKANPAGVTENPLSMCGVKAGVQTATNFVQNAEVFSQNCEANGLPPLAVTEFPSAADVSTALEAGQINATFTSLATARWQESQGREVESFASPLIPSDYHGIVVGKDETDLAKALTGALEAAIADGTYQEALKKWNLEELALLEPGINLGETRPLEDPELCGACGLE